MEATIDIRTADGNVNILLDDAQVGSMREVLVDLCLSTHAVFAMLIDAAGRLVTTGGETKGYELEAIAALAAGDLATSRQLAAMLNEPEFALLFQHEKQKNLFMTTVENDAILIVVFDVDTTFGALRLRIRRSISQLQAVLHQARRSTVVALSSTADVSASDDLHAVDDLMAVPVGPAAPAPAASGPPPSAAPPAPAPTRPADPEAPSRSAETASVSPEDVMPGGSPRMPAPSSTPSPAPPPPAVAVPEGPAPLPAGVAPPPPGAGLPDGLAVEIRKALAWFESFKGWRLVFADEVEFLSRGLERNKAEETDTLRSIFLRTRARLTEQKRLLEARFRLIQSLYQQFVTVLQTVMAAAWHDEIVDRAMKAAFQGVGQDHNMIGSGVTKKEGRWSFDFTLIGKHLVTVCHAKGWTYQQGMIEVLHQLNSALSALSAFIIEDVKAREELTRQWARLYRHYADGLKTLELEPEVLDLFRPLVRTGTIPK
jgi:predicted regulator of Ras-like GTPase activity (Roadblock/LC7/MglB family)